MNEDRNDRMERTLDDTPEEQLQEQRTLMGEQAAEHRTAAGAAQEALEPLFEEEEAGKFRTEWLSIQSKFVDDPRASVKQADELVASVLKSVTMGFSDRRVALEKQWNSGDNTSTEDLRQALKRYRSFFDRLLTLES